MADLITVSQAKDLIFQHVGSLRPIQTGLNNASGKVLAEDIISPLSIPSYPQSSMDGYAINLQGWKKYGSLRITNIVAAGSTDVIELGMDEAVRIFTGAAVPKGADTVIMQEHAVVKENVLVSIGSSTIEAGSNVRTEGSEIQRGAQALQKGALLTPGAIGFLAGMGINSVNVIPLPAVGIIVTGNELLSVGTPLKFGMVYDSNSHALLAALKEAGITQSRVYHVHDSPEHLSKVLSDAIKENDMVILTGGVSVGDYDHVITSANASGVKRIFHKVRQKPGKPIFFGMEGGTPVFGLPGNPASVLTCFYEYITLALSRLTGQNHTLDVHEAVLSGSYKKPAGITHFLKGIYSDGKVHLPEGQESYKMNSFAIANCLVVIQEMDGEVKEGQKVEIHRFFK